MLPKATIVCVFAFLSLISIAPAAAQQRSPALQQQAVQMQAVATCKVGGKQVMAGQIVADARGGRLRQRRCRGGRLVPLGANRLRGSRPQGRGGLVAWWSFDDSPTASTRDSVGETVDQIIGSDGLAAYQPDGLLPAAIKQSQFVIGRLFAEQVSQHIALVGQT